MSDTVVYISSEGHRVQVEDAKESDIREAREKLLAEKKKHEAEARRCGELIAGLTVSLAMIQLSVNQQLYRRQDYDYRTRTI